MFPKKTRINKGLFDLILKKGHPLYSQEVSLRILKGEGENRMAVVAEKKASKLASSRNKLRRQGYYILKKYQKDISKGQYFIFFIKKNISFYQIEKEILSLLSRSGLIKK